MCKEEKADMQVNKILSLFLSGLIIFQTLTVSAEPFIEEDTPIAWEPAAITLQAGELTIEAFYLMEGVPAPHPGLLIDREIFNRLEFAMNEAEEWCASRLQKERKLCDEKLAERDEACRKLNGDLIVERDRLLLDVKNLNKDLKSEKLMNNILLYVGGTVILSLAGTLIFLQVK